MHSEENGAEKQIKNIRQLTKIMLMFLLPVCCGRKFGFKPNSGVNGRKGC
ncbi:MAG: hypothetical protein HY392_04185 [Candidatus Diapherotrites archaeon]|nr:hypothetical protein [Candidatus Diapherotrites archaeon]